MKILVLNGSPAGEDSITLQTMHYLQICFPKQEYEELHVGRQIRSFEKDFTKAREMLSAAELIVFCYPVYTFLVPAQLHRFIELIKEDGVELGGKYATQITTSKHFYDTTAHEFIRENCRDLGLRYLEGFSADMEDLLGKQGQREARAFFHHTLWSMKSGIGALAPMPERQVVVVADLAQEDEELAGLIEEFRKTSPFGVEVVNLQEFHFAGGCLGCFHCAADGKCIYKDGFDSFLRERIQTADACVYAFRIKDHSMGQRFKLFDDRQFCNGHRTVTMGKPVGYLIAGDLEKEPNLRILIEARAQVGGNYLAGVAVRRPGEGQSLRAEAGRPGEGPSGQQVAETEVRALAANLAYALRYHYTQPANFYGVGGMKIFRDLIYQMQGMMREDHRFYKDHGFYDFPQKRMGTVLGMYLVGAMMNNKTLSRKLGGNMTKGMLMPYQHVIDKKRQEKMRSGSEKL